MAVKNQNQDRPAYTTFHFSLLEKMEKGAKIWEIEKQLELLADILGAHIYLGIFSHDELKIIIDELISAIVSWQTKHPKIPKEKIMEIHDFTNLKIRYETLDYSLQASRTLTEVE